MMSYYKYLQETEVLCMSYTIPYYQFPVTQDRVSFESFCFVDHQMIIQEIKRQHGLVIDLKHHIVQILQFNNMQADHVLQAFDDILCCSNGIISKMEAEVSNGVDADPGVDKGNGRNAAYKLKVLEEDGTITKNKRRKNAQHTNTVVTATPDYDGYEWRKYGQKWISKTRYSRSYYRCTKRKEQGCMATKTVQQMENDNTSNNVAKLYNIDYFGKHTCNGDEMVCPDIIETDSSNTFTIHHHKGSNTSLTNDSDDHQLKNEINNKNFFTMPDVSLFSDNIWEMRFEDVTMNSTISLQQEAMDSWIGYQQESPINLWADELF